MRKYILIVCLGFFIVGCIVETTDCYTAKIVNNTQNDIVIIGFDTLGFEKELYRIKSNNQIVISEFCDEIVSVKFFSYSYDSLKVIKGDSVEYHYDKDIVSSKENAILYEHPKCLFNKGWVRTVYQKNKKSKVQKTDTYIFE